MKNDIIVSIEDFDIRRILDCGQVFRYFPEEGGYTVISGDKLCRVTQDESRAVISSDDPDYFADYFDLSADYRAIRGELQDKPFMREAVEYGRGIRILRQQPFETLMSFIVSANNHIPRIKGILNRICEKLGRDIGGGRFAFPSPEAMAAKDEAFYASLGAGYRAEYLADTARRIADGFDACRRTRRTGIFAASKAWVQRSRIAYCCLRSASTTSFRSTHGYARSIPTSSAATRPTLKCAKSCARCTASTPASLSNICFFTSEKRRGGNI